MPKAKDFRRTTNFDPARIRSSGKHIGSHVYWKLYASENLIRVIIHSVLSSQVGLTWWSLAVEPRIQQKAQGFRTSYSARPWHNMPGHHDVYYVDLSDLNNIIRANSHLFAPAIPDIDQWIARIEQSRLPRNVVAHMNWPTDTDSKRIDVLFADLQALAAKLGSPIPMSIP
jgi:hypothetical protein